MGKQIVTLIIEDGKKTSKEVLACRAESTNVVITAPTLREALLLLSGTEEADTAQKHYYTIGRSVEEMEESMAEYEATDKGRRFLASIENAKQFYMKHSRGYGLRCTQLGYLAYKYNNNLINGCFDITALAYRTGYRDGQKTAK